MAGGGGGHAAPSVGRGADLHAHSTASDGAATPTALIERAQAVGLAVVALTDHDTVAGIEEARTAGARLGVEVVAGIELSAVEDEGETHLLGLHLTNVGCLGPALERLREARVGRAETMLLALRTLGVPVTMEAILVQAQGGALGRPHVARALVAAGWVRDERDAFDRFLGAGRPAFVPKARLSLADAIGLVHDAGGVAVLAHPARQGTLDYLQRLQRIGLDGVEVRHPSHTAEDEARLGTLAEHLDLVPSGGSDWHGAVEGPRVLGAITIPTEWVERQAARARARRGPGSGQWSSTSGSPS
jgi:3',5'-nucleoside bisphosphate phosphatase